MTAYQIFSTAAVNAGCPMDQTFNLVKGEAWLQERQLAACAAARLCDQSGGPTGIGYGGARGGGKSHWLLAQMGVDDCQTCRRFEMLAAPQGGQSQPRTL